MRFPPVVTSVGDSRRFIDNNLAGWPEAVVEAAVLMTSELVTNAVVHGGTHGEVSVRVLPGAVRVAVRDESNLMPSKETPSQLDDYGRGLVVVSELADRWGVVENVLGKSVWFMLWVNDT